MLLVYVILSVFTLLILRTLLRKITIRNFGNKYVFITGCDSGFGHDLAKRLDNMGFRVFAGCFTKGGLDTLQNCCSDKLVTIQIDVTADSSIEKAVEQVKRKLPSGKGLWAIVNNAGVAGGVGPTFWLTRKDYDDTFAVNLFGVIFVTQAFLPLIIQEKGRVVNTSSVMGRFPICAAPYAVSKYGVEGFSDTLRREIYKSGATVHIVEPGFFETPLINSDAIKEKMRQKLDSLKPEVRSAITEQQEHSLINGFDAIKAPFVSKDTFKVVDAYVHAITAVFPKHRYVVGFDANVIFRTLWNLPEWLADYLMVGRNKD